MENKIIKKNYHITELITKRDSTANKYFIVYKSKNKLEHYRYAISVGKKYGNAVNRNKMKRRLKNIIYNIDIDSNYDILIIVRPLAIDLSFLEIESHLKHVLTKANIIVREDK